MTDAYARSTDLGTSHAAAASVRATRLEEIVYRTLCAHSEGATSFEIADLLGMSLVTISPRLRPLASKGLIVEAGARPGESGRLRTVWKIAPPKTPALPVVFDEHGQASWLP